jgi:ribonuclease T2
MVHRGTRSKLRLRAGLPGRAAVSRSIVSRLFGALLLVCLSPVAARAQGQSSAPGGIPARSSAPFDFYVLALSWAPSFCAADNRDRGGSECAPGAKLGFVVHGLWPQNEHGFPENCDPGAARAPRYVLDQTRGLYPSVGLQIHEWRTHGTCSGLSPSAYFDQVRRAQAMVRIPPRFDAPAQQQSLAPNEAMRAFLEANPRLRSGMLAIACAHGLFEEARICLSKDLRDFHYCPEVARDRCRAGVMTAPAPQ